MFKKKISKTIYSMSSAINWSPRDIVAIGEYLLNENYSKDNKNETVVLFDSTVVLSKYIQKGILYIQVINNN